MRVMVFVSCFLPVVLGAENPKLDSLRGLLNGQLKPLERCNILIQVGDLLMQDDFPAATEDFKLALAIAKENDLQEQISMANNSMMMGYTAQGAYALALEYGQSALLAAQKARKDFRVLNVLINIANIHFYMERFEEALARYREALKYLEALEKPAFRTSAIYLNIGAVYVELGRQDSALANFERSMQWVGKMETPSDYMISALYNNVGTIHQEQGRFDLALTEVQKALNYARAAGDWGQIATTSINLASVLVDRKDFAQAKTHLTYGDSLVAAFGLGPHAPDVQLQWSNYYEEIGQPEQALSHFKRYEAIKDSLGGQADKEVVAGLQAAYDNERQQTRIDLLELEREGLEADKRLRSWIITAICLALFLAIGVGAILYYGYRRQQRLNRKLEDLSREKDGLIGFVAHDLKAPLTKVRLLVAMLRESKDDTKDQERLLDMLDKVAIDGSLLIEDLLALSAMDGEIQPMSNIPTDLGELLVEIAHGQKPVADAKQIMLKCSVEPCTIHTDPIRLMRVVENLLSNAIKFSPPGRAVMLNLLVGVREVEISVQDQGPGISEADQKRMFKRFQRLSARPTAGESSTGLGLAIVKALTEQLGGRVTCDSKLAKGTTFILYLPRQ